MSHLVHLLARGAWLHRMLALGALLVVLSVGFVGTHQGMATDRAGVMTSCLLTLETAGPCQMSATEHLALWQQLFQAVPAAEFAPLMAFGVLLAAAIVHRHDAALVVSGAYRRYTRDHPDLRFFDCFRRAVSDGILHPRLYA